jgi:apolipoprotein N-acyltransferase
MIIAWFERKSFLLRALAALATGAIMAFAMPPTALWPLMFLCFSFFYLLLAGQSGWRSAALGWAFGFGYFLVGLYWIGNALLVPGNPFKWVWPLTIAGLPVLLALFTGLSCWAATRLGNLRTWAGYMGFIGFIMLGEWLRGHIFTGFPWNLYGYSWARHLSMVQIVSIVGTYGLSLITLACATLPGFLLVRRPNRHTVSLAIFAVVTVLNVGWLWGSHRLNTTPTQLDQSIIIRIVQPNIAQEDKWNGDKIAENFQQLLIQSAAPKKPDTTTITLWPETAISDYIAANENAITMIARDVFMGNAQDRLISGVLRHGADANGQPLYYNSLITYDAQMNPITTYDKSHLVPFGEYIPFNDIIPLKPFVDFSGFTPGPGVTSQVVDGIPPFSGLVCYEVIFPGAVTPTQNNTAWMVNVTNDGWYGDSPGPYQHLTMAIFRAVEEGLPLARSANTGLSALIDPLGRVLSRIPYGVAAYADHPLPKPMAHKSIYARYKEIPTLTAIFALIACVAINYKKSKNAAKTTR